MANSEASQLRRDYAWNTAASLMASASTVILQVVVTRAAGLHTAGVFALAFAVGQQFQTLGMYEVRTFHITDAARQFDFGTYLSTRFITLAAMILGIIGYADVSGDTAGAALLVALVACLKTFDAFEDVFASEFQRSGRLDVGARACFWRLVVTTLVFSVALVLTGSLLVTTIVTLICSAIALVALNLPPAKGLFAIAPTWSAQGIRRVLIACLPLFAASFIAIYLPNAPRFAIDLYLDPTQQGYFAILFMPAVAINLFSIVVFRPLLTRMATSWLKADWTGFVGIIRRGLVTTLVAFVLVAVVTYVAGVPILGFIYGKDISAYLLPLMILVAGGLSNAASVVLYYALATMRHQHLVFGGYLVAAIAMTVLCVILVPRFQLVGASCAYAAAMTILVVVFVIAMGWGKRTMGHVVEAGGDEFGQMR